jgi:drug/metabolite transporter (DMT)-like permease
MTLPRAVLMQKHSAYGLLSGLSAAAIWGAMYVVSKAVMETIQPFTLITSRLLLGIGVLFIVLLLRGGIKLSNRSFWKVFGVGTIGYGVSLGFQFVGTKLSTASNGSLVTSATPAFVLFFAAMILGEKITARRIIALALATLGVIAVIDPRTAQLEPGLFLGNISLVLAAITWALYSVLIRKVTREVDVLTTSLVAFMGGLVISVPLSMLEIINVGIGEVTLPIIAGILFLGVISTALAMFLWNTAFAELPAGVASLTFFAQPVVGTILGAFFLGDAITPMFIAGGVLIGSGIVISASG